MMCLFCLISGRVVNMSSMNGRYPWPCTSAYNATKYGIECVSDCLRLEMAKFGVNVAVIEPAMFGGSTEIHNDQNVGSYRVCEPFNCKITPRLTGNLTSICLISNCYLLQKDLCRLKHSDYRYKLESLYVFYIF